MHELTSQIITGVPIPVSGKVREKRKKEAAARAREPERVVYRFGAGFSANEGTEEHPFLIECDSETDGPPPNQSGANERRMDNVLHHPAFPRRMPAPNQPWANPNHPRPQVPNNPYEAGPSTAVPDPSQCRQERTYRQKPW